MQRSGFVLQEASVEMSSQAWSIGATLCHACSVSATHDRSSRDFKLYWLVVLGGMVLRCTMVSTATCSAVRVQGGGAVGRRGGVDGCRTSKDDADLFPKDGLAVL